MPSPLAITGVWITTGSLGPLDEVEIFLRGIFVSSKN
jgi:hypothetical protein